MPKPVRVTEEQVLGVLQGGDAMSYLPPDEITIWVCPDCGVVGLHNQFAHFYNRVEDGGVYSECDGEMAPHRFVVPPAPQEEKKHWGGCTICGATLTEGAYDNAAEILGNPPRSPRMAKSKAPAVPSQEEERKPADYEHEARAIIAEGDVNTLRQERDYAVALKERAEESLVSLTEAARDVLAKADKSSIIHSSFGPAFEALRRALPDTEIPDA